MMVLAWLGGMFSGMAMLIGVAWLAVRDAEKPSTKAQRAWWN